MTSQQSMTPSHITPVNSTDCNHSLWMSYNTCIKTITSKHCRAIKSWKIADESCVCLFVEWVAKFEHMEYCQRSWDSFVNCMVLYMNEVHVWNVYREKIYQHTSQIHDHYYTRWLSVACLLQQLGQHNKELLLLLLLLLLLVVVVVVVAVVLVVQ